MKSLIVVFRSRNETIKFVNLINSYNYPASVISTPRQISVSCGISAKIENNALEIAKLILSRRQFYTFGGIYYFNGMQYVKVS